MKFTILDFDRVYREEGVNLLNNDLKKDYLNIANIYLDFCEKQYDPYIKLYNKLKKPSDAQVKRKNELDFIATSLLGDLQFQKIIYYAKVREYLIGDTLENENITMEEIEEFANVFELSMNQYFYENVSRETTEEENEEKKYYDRFGISHMRLPNWVYRLLPWRR